MIQTTYKVEGLDPIIASLQADAKQKNAYLRAGLVASAMHLIRKVKKDYLRKPDTFSRSQASRASVGHELGRTSGKLAASMAFDPKQPNAMVKIGWFKSAYAHVVAEPPEGVEETTIHPRGGHKYLMFPLTTQARTLWPQRGRPWGNWQERVGKTVISEGITIAGKRLTLGKDFAFARSVVIRARRPASHALYMESPQIEKIMLNKFRVLGEKIGGE